MHSARTASEDDRGELYEKAINAMSRRADVASDSRFIRFLARTDGAYGQFEMYKKSGGRFREKCCKVGSWFNCWQTRTVHVYHKGVAYTNVHGRIREFLPFCSGFTVACGPSTGKALGVVLTSNHRRLTLQAQHIYDFVVFLYLLQKLCGESPYMRLNRFNSFAPLRQHNWTRFYVDGADYFGDLARAMLAARRTIYLTGWMFSPEFLLLRGTDPLELQQILKLAADRHVKVWLVVYQESSFLCNDSLHAKQTLQALSPNITVLRHPNSKLPVLWSHHSKMAIIDQQEAYFGGLDLCYGRYDDSKHHLADHFGRYPGIEYCNIRLEDTLAVRMPDVCSISRSQPRMPWHDVGQCVRGDIVNDFSHHFHQFWSFVAYQTSGNEQPQYHDSLFQSKESFFSKSNSKIDPKGRSSQKGLLKRLGSRLKRAGQHSINRLKSKMPVQDKNRSQLRPMQDKRPELISRSMMDTAPREQLDEYISNVRQQIETKNKFDLKMQALHASPKTELQTYRKRFSNDLISELLALKTLRHTAPKVTSATDLPSDRLDSSRVLTPRKVDAPGRGLSLLLSGDKAKQFIEMDIGTGYLNCLERVQKQLDVEDDLLQQEECESGSEDSVEAGRLQERAEGERAGQAECQLVRSVGNWSIGCHPQHSECSIQIAYLQLIAQARHYVYIENQFFISSTAGPAVKNQIANTLLGRIVQAIDSEEDFKVYVVLPLLPGFAGDLAKEQCTMLRKTLDWQNRTILHAAGSLLAQLQKHTDRPQDYIRFFSLRQHGLVVQRPQTEIIYLHSKLLLVDDLFVLVGSANINDRSMLGNRDSEIAVVTNAGPFVETVLKGQPRTVSKPALDLRTALFQQHFAVRAQSDPASNSTWQAIADRAHKNTGIYRELFGCYPDDSMPSLPDIARMAKQPTLEEYHQKKANIVGHVVEYPLLFLQENPVQVALTDKTFYLPEVCLT